jgi:hypothetical protein
MREGARAHGADVNVHRVQAVVPEEVHRRQRLLGVDCGRSMADLVLDALVLLVRYHDPRARLGAAPSGGRRGTRERAVAVVSVGVGEEVIVGGGRVIAYSAKRPTSWSARPSSKPIWRPGRRTRG